MMEISVSDLLNIMDRPSGAPVKPANHSIKDGEAYLIRTVTMMYTGIVANVSESDIVLKDAAWIADSGRYNNSLLTGELNEVEPYPEYVIVNRAAIVDIAPWKHLLPREVK